MEIRTQHSYIKRLLKCVFAAVVPNWENGQTRVRKKKNNIEFYSDERLQNTRISDERCNIFNRRNNNDNNIIRWWR